MMPQAKKVAYISLVLNSSSGVFRKLSEQAEACSRLSLPFDIYWITSERNNLTSKETEIKIISVPHNSNLEFRFRQVLHFNRISSQYHSTFLRYPLIDPILFAFCFPKNFSITEHHTKELEEMKLAGDWRYPYERFLGPSFARRFSAISAVTKELLEYETVRFKASKPALMNSNCINLDRYSRLIPNIPIKEDGKLRLVMTCADFVPWHGLDKILDHLRQVPNEEYELHLCGNLSEEQTRLIKQYTHVIHHGNVSRDRLWDIYKECHVGLSCFALERKGMKEASSLKVREYLACGLPAAYGHHDSAFPASFPFVCELPYFDFPAIRDWISKISGLRRDMVVKASSAFISMESLVQRQYKFATSF